MSETYPRKTLCETLFAGHISLQRRNRLQRYNKKCKCASIASIIFKNDRFIYLIRDFALNQARLNVRC